MTSQFNEGHLEAQTQVDSQSIKMQSLHLIERITYSLTALFFTYHQIESRKKVHPEEKKETVYTIDKICSNLPLKYTGRRQMMTKS